MRLRRSSRSRSKSLRHPMRLRRSPANVRVQWHRLALGLAMMSSEPVEAVSGLEWEPSSQWFFAVEGSMAMSAIRARTAAAAAGVEYRPR